MPVPSPAAEARRHFALAALAGCNLLAGFLWQAVIYARLGPGASTDALVAAAVAPQAFTGMVGVALTSVLIPLFAGEERSGQNADGRRCHLQIGLLGLAAALALCLAAPWWTGLLFPGFDAETARLCAGLARVQALSVPFQLATTILSALLYARDRYVLVEAAALAATAPGLALLYHFLPDRGVEVAAWLGVGRAAVVWAVLLPTLGRTDGRPPRVGLAALLWRRGRPILANTAYAKADVFVDRSLLSMSAGGHLSLYDLAQQMAGTGANLLGKVWGATAVAGLAARAKAGDAAGFLRLYRRRLALLLFLSGLAYLLLLAVGEPLLGLLAGRGRLTGADMHTLWTFLVLLGGVLVFGCAGVVTAGAFFALGDTRTPSLAAAAAFTLFMVGKIVLFPVFGVAGVCVAASACSLACALAQHLLFRRLLRKGLAFGTGGAA